MGWNLDKRTVALSPFHAMEQPIHSPSPSCESAAFWMRLEHRLSRIEDELDDVQNGVLLESLKLAKDLGQSRRALAQAIATATSRRTT